MPFYESVQHSMPVVSELLGTGFLNWNVREPSPTRLIWSWGTRREGEGLKPFVISADQT
jgi:hypothetical protein